MSTLKNYQPGRTFMLLVSDDNWTTTLTVVCLNKQGLKRSRPVNSVDTQCGFSKAYGSADRKFDAEAVNNLTPDAVVAGVGEASYKKFASWFEANTELKFKREAADDTQLFQEFSGKLASLDDANDVNTNMTFSFTVEIESIDETP